MIVYWEHQNLMQNNLQIDSLSKSYNGVEAVDNISFAIKKNEIIGLLGPNGCGKTTTIGMILGLLKPSKGRVLIDNQDIEKNRINVLKKINFINFPNLFHIGSALRDGTPTLNEI